jgi:protein phosphatase
MLSVRRRRWGSSFVTDYWIPDLSLVVLIGASGSGKSTFARRHFLATEVLSSDACRGWVSDDENNQAVSQDAFDVLHYIASKRLAAGRLTVVDATNVQKEARESLVVLARKYHVLPVAIVLDVDEAICQARNAQRADRNFGAHVIRQQRSQLRRAMRQLRGEGFRYYHVLRGTDAIDQARIARTPLWCDKRSETGALDIVGDVHGCADELQGLLSKLGYEPYEVGEDQSPFWGTLCYRHPAGRRAVFVGDLVDRGPRVIDTLRIVRNMVVQSQAYCVPGNHDDKLLRKLKGNDVQVKHGLEQTLAEIDQIDASQRGNAIEEIKAFLASLVSHYVFDGGKLVVAHAGMKQAYQGRGSGRVRDFALYGETTGETDEFGLPIRYPWAADYRGSAKVVYGHTPIPHPQWLNRTINIDTGCVFGGRLTALRYPELQLVSVDATRVYCEPVRPIGAATGIGSNAVVAGATVAGLASSEHWSDQHQSDDLLDVDDVIGKRSIETTLHHRVNIAAPQAAAALEVMSRFAINPKWLIYLPPTMSPTATSELPEWLEHPLEAFDYYRQHRVETVVCQQKHMGSRAVVIACRDQRAAGRCFGIESPGDGVIYTRTGRRFFADGPFEQQCLDRIRAAMERARLWDRFQTDWIVMDTELMPWSAKAQSLLHDQYAAVGAAGRAALPAALQAIQRAADRLPSADAASARQQAAGIERRITAIDRFSAAYREYCWPVESVDDLKIAPFHLLATANGTHEDQTHLWHMQQLAELAAADPGLLMATDHRVVSVNDDASVQDAIQWWETLTASGGEGMVVKPLAFVARDGETLLQPAVKCRGREYLRIIYGPDYDDPKHLATLRKRGLNRKRSLALREFALGIEGLQRFVRHEPLRRVHECVFAVLALESDPVDPRL